MTKAAGYLAEKKYGDAMQEYTLALNVTGYENDAIAKAGMDYVQRVQAQTQAYSESLQRNAQEDRWIGFWRCDTPDACGNHMSIGGAACKEIRRTANDMYVVQPPVTTRKYSDTRNYFYPLPGSYELSITDNEGFYYLPFESGLTDIIFLTLQSSDHIMSRQSSQNAGANGRTENFYRVNM